MKEQKVMPVLVSFFTHGWMQQCVKCFQEWFPELNILVIDNNPTAYNQINNFGFPWNPSRSPQSKWKCLFKHTLAERDWLRDQGNVILLNKPTNDQLSHAESLHMAHRWCRDNQVEIILILDADCCFNGVEWFYNLLLPLVADDLWMTIQRKVILSIDGTSYDKFYGLDVPYMQKVREIKWSFDTGIRGNNHYDTMAWAYKQCEIEGKVKTVDKAEFVHYGGGTYKRIIHNQRNSSFVSYI
jgi:hypothetical protein